MCKTIQSKAFHETGPVSGMIWAVPAIHGEMDRLIRLHDAIFSHFKTGDRILYFGNYTGYGAQSAECVDELLTFRRMILALPGVLATDIIYLRGLQEEIWHKLLQIQFAPDPADTLIWMFGNGLSNTLYSYGLSPHDGVEACRHGVMGLTKWTNRVREAVRKNPGHETFTHHQYRAAYTPVCTPSPLLFVPAGLSADQPLENQGDSFWWGADAFDRIQDAYAPFKKVIRGYDPAHRGIKMNCVTATIDDGCGFGGNLVAAAFEPNGDIARFLEA